MPHEVLWQLKTVHWELDASFRWHDRIRLTLSIFFIFRVKIHRVPSKHQLHTLMKVHRPYR